jgi:hypothetical protein
LIGASPAGEFVPFEINISADVGQVTLPAAAHVMSPRKKVEDDAPAPPARLPTGRLPVTSVVRLTAAKDGGLVPCRTVVFDPTDKHPTTAPAAG